MAHQIDPGSQTVIEKAKVLENGILMLRNQKAPTIKIGTLEGVQRWLRET